MTPTAKTTSPTSRAPDIPYLEKQVNMTPARLESLWDNWHSQAEQKSSSYSDSSSNNPSITSSEEWTSHRPPLNSPRVGKGKRWGMLKTLRPNETSSNVGKDTNTRENQDKQKAGTGRNPMKLKKPKPPGELGAPSMRASHSLALPVTPITPQNVATPNKFGREYFESSDSAIYFTVDPNWNASKGDPADLFLLTDIPT
ncbi:hypothetical protein C0995_003838 [Termitomyces sp. Mi166|nr:hypothetical protein C0995_003838 [Termitomyces sp. Mi166\